MPRYALTATDLEQAGQLTLFACIGTPGDSSCQCEASNDDLDETEEPPFTHIIVSATKAEPIKCKGPSSVFDLASGAFGPLFRAPKNHTPVLYRVKRHDGVTRVQKVQIQDTQEWKDREASRRAKQRPPRPTEAAKTRGRKLSEVI